MTTETVSELVARLGVDAITEIARRNMAERIAVANGPARDRDLAWLTRSQREAEVVRRDALPEVSDERKAAIAARVADRRARA